jgi:hypothetical protein
MNKRAGHDRAERGEKDEQLAPPQSRSGSIC